MQLWNAFSTDIRWLYAYRLFIIILATFITWFLTERILARLFAKAAKRTRATWDDVFIDRKIFNKLATITPGLIVFLFAGYLFPHHASAIKLTQNLAYVYLLFTGASVVFSLLDVLTELADRSTTLTKLPLRSLSQVLKIILFIVLTILTASILLNKSPALLLTGLTGLTAILMLIFKDAILGLVAGVQLTANRMLSVGDWLEMPSQKADGDVIDITLTTVKVQNWDKTITCIPAYALISQSFKNWKGMSESGGRRIKRALYIDMTSIQFCTPEMLNKYQKYQLINHYIMEKTADVANYNKENKIDESELLNGRRLTNIGTFRAYVVAYLKNHPKIHKDMTFLVRQLAPTDHGLPLEIYVFSNDQVWANYEAIQSDIFDHLLAIIPEFSLKVFQNPTGFDFRRLD